MRRPSCCGLELLPESEVARCDARHLICWDLGELLALGLDTTFSQSQLVGRGACSDDFRRVLTGWDTSVDAPSAWADKKWEGNGGQADDDCVLRRLAF